VFPGVFVLRPGCGRSPAVWLRLDTWQPSAIFDIQFWRFSVLF